MVSVARAKLWANLQAGDARTYHTLRVVPLLGPSSTGPPYRLFDGESQKDVTITEVSEDGSVPDIRLRNGLDSRVLLIDGQELIGAKQNRVLNVDVLVAAGAEVIVPVSCVEAGRWSHVSRCFSSGKMMHRSARATKCLDIASSYRAKRGPRSDQGKVWHDVDALLGKLDVHSSTAAMADAYTKRNKELAEIREALKLPADAIGVAVYERDRFLGLDLFDRATTFARQWELLMDSYAIYWLAFAREEGRPDVGAPLSVDKLLETLAAADWERYDAPGEGSTVRSENERCTASALVWGQDSVVHLQAFPRPDEGTRLQDSAPRDTRRGRRCAQADRSDQGRPAAVQHEARTRCQDAQGRPGGRRATDGRRRRRPPAFPQLQTLGNDDAAGGRRPRAGRHDDHWAQDEKYARPLRPPAPSRRQGRAEAPPGADAGDRNGRKRLRPACARTVCRWPFWSAPGH